MPQKFIKPRRRSLRRGQRLPLGRIIIRERYAGTQQFYTGRGDTRAKRWSNDPKKAQVYWNQKVFDEALEEAEGWAGANSELAAGELEIKLTDIVKRAKRRKPVVAE